MTTSLIQDDDDTIMIKLNDVNIACDRSSLAVTFVTLIQYLNHRMIPIHLIVTHFLVFLPNFW